MFIKKYFKNFVKNLLGLKSLLEIKIEENCCNEKGNLEEVTCFVYERLRRLLKLNNISIITLLL